MKIEIHGRRPFYEDERSQIWNADCGIILPQIPDNHFTVCMFDPPYNVGKNYGCFRDKLSRQRYRTWMGSILHHAIRVAELAVILPGHKQLGMWVSLLEPDMIGIWKRGSCGMFRSGSLDHSITFDPILFYCGRCTHYRSVRDYYEGPALPVKSHPGGKPAWLASAILAQLEPASVLDPFAGTGSTLEGALNNGAIAVGIELNPDFCRIAEERCRKNHLPFVKGEATRELHLFDETSVGDRPTDAVSGITGERGTDADK